MMSQHLKIATWNVNGIRARQHEVREWIAEDRLDIICLQEIKASPAQVPPELCELEGYWCYWHGEKGYSGVGLHIRRDLSLRAPRFSHPLFDFECRIVMGEVGSLTVASVYVPNGGKDFPAKIRFLEQLEALAAGFLLQERPLVICGDINVTRTDMDVHPKERRPGVIGQLPEERALLDRLLAQGLVDVGRELDHSNEEMFTWWAPWRNLRQRNIGWRLDYILASRMLAERAVTCPVRREVGTSDHAPVVATFQVEGVDG
jgi:exodeoxyribonuclease III